MYEYVPKNDDFRLMMLPTRAKLNESIILDTIMETIKENDHRTGKTEHDKVPREKIKYLLNKVTSIFLQEQTLLEIEPPIVICADTHGQYSDLLDIMDHVGWPPEKRYLFLGDYVDRGEQSIELITLLLTLKAKYPTQFYMLRGNHETSEVNSDYGFKDDCVRFYDIGIWDAFQECFKCLPLAAVVGSRILCMHGGLSPCLESIDEIRKIPRPVDIPEDGMICDMLWSDPIPHEDHLPFGQQCGYRPNISRRTSVWFYPDVVNDFLTRNDLELIVRGHELVQEGYSFTDDKKVLTLFTAPYYCNEHKNDAAVLLVDEQLQCQIRTFKFKKTITSPNPSIYGSAAPLIEADLWTEVTLRDKSGKSGTKS